MLYVITFFLVFTLSLTGNSNTPFLRTDPQFELETLNKKYYRTQNFNQVKSFYFLFFGL